MQIPDKSILLKCLSGHATPEEAAMIDSWIAASPENRQEFDRLWKLWQMTDTNPAYTRPDITAEWNILHARIDPTAAPHTPGRALISHPLRAASWELISVIVAGIIVAGVILIKIMSPGEIKGAGTIGGRPQKNSRIEPRIKRYSGASILKDTMSDHIVITLDTQSSISYPAGNDDSGALIIKGKAFIQAVETPAKPITPESSINPTNPANAASPITPAKPITIVAGDVVIHASGSNFYLAYDSAAASSSVQVAKGELQITDHNKVLSLKEGQSILYDGQKHQFIKKDTLDVNTFGYATRVFNFNNTPVKEVIGDLAKAYGVTFRLDNPAIGDCRITTEFDNKPIRYVLDVLTETLNLTYKYKEQGKIIAISGQGCE
jgi:transmembrane sensor